ncbi:hypothetical protein [Actinophytocola oryzae]|nr:hypothetical protein [Actinophytocola oryzae]
MQDLITTRRAASPEEFAAIDEQMDRLCEEAAANIAGERPGELSKPLRRMKQLTFDEMIEMRDKAKRVDR